MLFLSAVEASIMKLLQDNFCVLDLNTREFDSKCWVNTADRVFWLTLYAPFFILHIVWLLFCCRDSCFRQSWDEVEAAEARYDLMQVSSGLL
jgi:hypothetical protein